MKVAILKEQRTDECRVAASPETVKNIRSLGCDVVIEKDAGRKASFTDQDFTAVGAKIVSEAQQALAQANVVLKVQRPLEEELELFRPGTVLIGLLDPYQATKQIQEYANKDVVSFALELIPRITRAQSMDVLSSQANLMGYKAVIEAVSFFSRSVPMMMTAAGTLAPAYCFVMGVGVAGLQAIATARRLGAIVCATDIRPATKEEVLSLGAKFIAVEDEEFQQAQTAGGYAKPMSEAYQKKQAELMMQTIKKQDIVITTALVPGKKAPLLVTTDMIHTMKSGSIVFDLAVEQGGNVQGSRANERVITQNRVSILSFTNLPSRIAASASALYAKNVLNFFKLFLNNETKTFSIPWQDEIIKATALTHNGQVLHSL